jgi:flagellar assembly protein FliH
VNYTQAITYSFSKERFDMPRTSPFSFNKDFRAVDVPEPEPDPVVRQDKYDADVLLAEQRGFERGEEVGRDAAIVIETARMGKAVERLGLALGQALHATELRLNEVEREAVELALACALKLAGHALRHYPHAALEEAAKACFTEARQAPHVVVRVNDTQVEGIKERLGRIAVEKGFAGKMVVLGDPDIEMGDGRLEWADGGFVHERAATEQLITRAAHNYMHELGPVAGKADDGEGTSDE